MDVFQLSYAKIGHRNHKVKLSCIGTKNPAWCGQAGTSHTREGSDTPTRFATVGNAGPNSVPVGAGDYNGDSRADILLQSTDGTPTIWTMNGTTVTSTTTLTNPGQTWHAITG